MSKVKAKDAYLEHMKNRGRTKTPMQHYDGGMWKSTDGFTSRKQRDGESD